MEKQEKIYFQHQIETYRDECLEDHLQNCPSLEVFSRLSRQAYSFLAWYPLQRSWRVLEFGAGYGEVTGFLCEKSACVDVVEMREERRELIAERCSRYENLTLYPSLDHIEENQRYNCILLRGTLEELCTGTAYREKASTLLGQVYERLEPDGRLLLAVDNRLGLRNFCGEVRGSRERPFAQLNRDYEERSTFTRAELEELLRGAGFEQSKCYYPLPDYRLTQVVYTDEYLPGRNLNERLIPYHDRVGTCVLSEYELYPDVTANGLFPAMANSFFFECFRGGDRVEFTSVVYAAISADRGRKQAYVTAICKREGGRYVEKLPLYPEGLEGAAKLAAVSDELRGRGVSVLPMQLRDGRLVMDYIEGTPLSVYLDCVAEDRERFLAVFDGLQELIMRSSELAPEDANVLRETAPKVTEWGPVLKKAYMELIPLNCFWTEGGLLFYDQEFVRENCPAGYVMFRAIYYTFGFSEKIRRAVSQREMIERYGLQEVWETYLREEESFLEQVRNRQKYKAFYEFAALPGNVLYDNIDRILGGRKILVRSRDGRFERPAIPDSLVIVGAGALFDAFLREYPTAEIRAVADNDRKKWGQYRNGYLIQSPEVLHSLPEKERRVLICSRYYEEIGRQLSDMGVKEIYTYASPDYRQASSAE